MIIMLSFLLAKFVEESNSNPFFLGKKSRIFIVIFDMVLLCYNKMYEVKFFECRLRWIEFMQFVSLSGKKFLMGC